ncbi:MAG TPA: argininosuccinate lyase [Nitrososphaeraceae archaeon]|nr:argininosuccinate lyase [Nitrososphaeraceae archaeon]
MYRSRHKEDLDKRTLNFLSSIDIDEKILYYDILCTKVHVIMLYKIKVLEKDEVTRLVGELKNVMQHPEKLSREGYEDIHEALETHLIRKLGINIGGKIQTGRSRNDQIITDIRIKARDDIINIIIHLTRLTKQLLVKSEDNLDSIMPLYTHLQQAQIGNFAHFLLSYSEGMLREIDRLFSLFERLNQSPLGAGPIGGSILPIDRNMTARLLGFDGIMSNSIDATSSRDFMIEFTSNMASIMITLSRISEDLIIWSSQEFGFIEISDKHASTSSAMPQKRNPDPLEITRSKAAIVIGNLTTIMTILKSLPSGYSRDLQDTKIPFWNSVELVVSSLEIMNDIIKFLVVKKDKMKRASIESYAISLDIAEILVTKYKVPFRTAHQLVGALVNLSASKNDKIPFSSLSSGDIRNVLSEMKVNITPDKIISAIKDIDSGKSIRIRSSKGSVNPKEQTKIIRINKLQLQKYSNEVQKRKKGMDLVKQNIEGTIKKLVSA